MYLISHRGNINGKTEFENQPQYILNASKNYYVEIDLWYINGQLYLGHDEAQYKTDLNFIHNEKFFCHAKNYDALEYMLNHNIHCFFHNNDEYTITSRGHAWQYPSSKVHKNSIFLFPEQFTNIDILDLKMVKGICSDYIENYKSLSNSKSSH